MPLATLILTTLLLKQAPVKPAPDKVLATVNGTSITAAEVEPYLWDWRSYEITQELVVEHLVDQEATRLKIEVTDKDVTVGLEDQLKQIKPNLQPGQDTDQFLREKGFSVSRISRQIRTRLQLQKIAEQGFSTKDFLKLSTMGFQAKSAGAADFTAAEKQAQTAYTKLKAGSKWLDILKTSTVQGKMVETEGLIGWVPTSAIGAENRAELSALPVKGISKPIKTQYGYQIFRVEALGKDATAAEALEMKSKFVQQKQAELLDSLRSKAKIEMFFGAPKPAVVPTPEPAKPTTPATPAPAAPTTGPSTPAPKPAGS